jgi:hypothetical protein
MPVSLPPKAGLFLDEADLMRQIAVHWAPRDLRYPAPGWVRE